MLSFTAQLVDRIRKIWFSSYGQLDSSGGKGGMQKLFLQFNMKASGGGAADFLDFRMQKYPFCLAVLAV